jgi:hypothetical protein
MASATGLIDYSPVQLVVLFGKACGIILLEHLLPLQVISKEGNRKVCDTFDNVSYLIYIFNGAR